jgi:hypothetical protein
MRITKLIPAAATKAQNREKILIPIPKPQDNPEFQTRDGHSLLETREIFVFVFVF